jgi:hypothetical protein
VAQAVAKITNDAEALLCFFDYPAEQRWRAINGPHLVALVRAGVRFEKGRLVERPRRRSTRSPRDHARLAIRRN